MKTKTIGLLALQGGYASHGAVLTALGQTVREVRTAAELALCDALVIPGGESTVLTKLLMTADWQPGPLHIALKEFAQRKPVMGTCAGLIMLARPCGNERVVSLDILPVSVERNAYGRQTESFVAPVTLTLPGAEDNRPYPAVFIRAPRIIDVNPSVQVLCRYGSSSEPIMVQYGKILALTFHPELSPTDTRVHEYFLSMIP